MFLTSSSKFQVIHVQRSWLHRKSINTEMNTVAAVGLELHMSHVKSNNTSVHVQILSSVCPLPLPAPHTIYCVPSSLAAACCWTSFSACWHCPEWPAQNCWVQLTFSHIFYRWKTFILTINFFFLMGVFLTNSSIKISAVNIKTNDGWMPFHDVLVSVVQITLQTQYVHGICWWKQSKKSLSCLHKIKWNESSARKKMRKTLFQEQENLRIQQ